MRFNEFMRGFRPLIPHNKKVTRNLTTSSQTIVHYGKNTYSKGRMVSPLPWSFLCSRYVLDNYRFNVSLRKMVEAMVKMKLNLRNALKSTLLELTSKTRKVLVFGEDRINKKTFCHPVDILRNRLRLLACTSIEIRSIGYYPHAERNIVNWLKEHLPKPTSISQSWWNICNTRCG